MTVAEQVLTRLSVLSEEQRQQVLDFVRKLEPSKKPPFVDPYGMFADLRADLPFEEFKHNRQEMWGQSTDKEI